MQLIIRVKWIINQYCAHILLLWDDTDTRPVATPPGMLAWL